MGKLPISEDARPLRARAGAACLRLAMAALRLCRWLGPVVPLYLRWPRVGLAVLKARGRCSHFARRC
jgi:hypothetical protein